MSADNAKSGRKSAAKAAADGTADVGGTSGKATGTGRVKFDDRGNAVWEWSIATGAFSAEVTDDRMRRLEHPSLSIADDAPTPVEIARSNPHGVVKGYNPYDSGKLAKPPDAAPKKKTDLRKLSEWLKLKKQADGNKTDEE